MSAVAAFNGPFVNNLVRFFKMNSAGKYEDMPEKIAEKITSEYVKAAKVGFNPIINNKIHTMYTKAQSPNVMTVKQTLKNAFAVALADESKDGKLSNTVISNALTMVPTLFWTGTMLEGVFKGMPPGHVNLVPGIMTTSPGVCVKISIPGQNLSKLLPKLPFLVDLGMKYANHLSTLMFFCPALILPSPSPPYPLPITGIV